MFDTLIYNAIVVTIDSRFRIIHNGAVAIRKGQIAEVRDLDTTPALPAAEERIDAEGGMVMPGLVNGHTHLPMVLYRGLADDLPLEQWLQEHMFPVEARFSTAENIPWAVQLACAEMLLGGVTTCCDGYFLADEIAETLSRIGMRAILAQGVIDFPAPGVPDPAKNIATAKAFVEKWQNRTPLIQPSIFCHAPYTCSADTLTAAHKTAEQAGVPFQIHVAETQAEAQNSQKEHGLSPVGYLNRLNLLTPSTLLIHAVWTDEADIKMMADAGAAVIHCPESNMKLASGIAPIGKYVAAGIRVGLGTDGCASNNDMDMFKEMDAMAKLHKVSRMDPTAMPARTVLEIATRAGAGALGLGARIGSLEPGKQADLIVLNPRQPHLTPLFHPESHLIYAAAAADVRHVMIEGRWVVRERELLTIDLASAMQQVNRIARDIQGTRA